MKRYLLMFLTGLTVATLSCLPASAGCLAEPAPCKFELGTYHLILPEGADPAKPLPAVMFLHGWGGTGAATIKNTGMMSVILDRGYAMIAPDGLPDAEANGGSWDFHPDYPQKRDEIAFLKGAADDAAKRFGIDRSRILLAGFSIGGSMTSYVACQDPGAFAAYAPVAGSFWRPHPAACAGPVRLLHTHGWTDVTVPLEGRSFGGGAFAQGDVFQAMEIWRAANRCAKAMPDGFQMTGIYWIRRWTGCADGSALEFALHEGAHGIPKGWATLALDWFEGL